MQFNLSRRIGLVALIAGGTVWSAMTHAQQTGTPVVGFLNPTWPKLYAVNAAAFREGLEQTDYVEGKNLRIEYRWAEGDYNRLAGLAAELVARQVAVIAATGDVATARAAQAATSKIPIVFTIGADPVRFG